MTRFFFDFHQDGNITPDETGVEFESAEAAYLAAVDGAHGLWGELLKTRQDPRRCSFEIRGNDKVLLFSLPFNELLDNCRDAPARPSLENTFREVRATHAFAQKVRGEMQEHIKATRQALRDAMGLLRERESLQALIPPASGS